MELRLDTRNSPIDIVIPWLNPDDEHWWEDYKFYKKLESTDEVNDEDFNGECRYRDMGTLKYTLRSIEQNCPWVNKVFLILRDEHQIPDWLNINAPKLEIVYHHEYIPAGLLPTFDSNVIEMYLHRIERLSNNYVLFNDDTLVMQPVDQSMFFIGNTPVHTGRTLKGVYYFDNPTIYQRTLNNNMNLLSDFLIAANKPLARPLHGHLQTPHNKAFELMLNMALGDKILSGFKGHHFRSTSDYTNYLYQDILTALGLIISVPNLYDNCRYENMTDNTDLKWFENKTLICLNDTINVTDYDRKKDEVAKWLDSKLKVSSYEA